MAVADATAYDAATKEIFHPDGLEKQFYTEHTTLDKLEKRTPAIEIGDKAVTPVQLEQAGGYSAVPRTGSDNLNPADAVGLARAEWQYAHHVKQCEIDTATVDETRGNAKAVAEVVTTEGEAALDTLRNQLTRQIFRSGDALIAQCDTGGASATVELLSTGFGYDAIVRGHLFPGQAIDIGTTGSEASVVGDAIIQSVSESDSDPDIVIDSSVSTTTSHYVSIANARSGTTSYESNGFANIAGSTSASLGGLDPATYTKWKPAHVDSTSTSLTLPLIYTQRRKVKQTNRKNPDWVLTSLKQSEAAYKLTQPQVRFNGDGDTGAGNVEGWKFAGMQVDEDPDCPDRYWFTLSKKHLFMVRTKKPHFQNEYTGGNIWVWKQDSTRLVSAMFYRCQLATDKRNSHAALVTLTD